MAAANMILTTSVAEGFGMVFLESCLAERPLVADLIEVARRHRAFSVEPTHGEARARGGVEHLLEFVRASKKAALLHVSTCFTAGASEGSAMS